MKPITLFDKSFIQSLHIDEAAWFDHFFFTNICPIFYTETIADLKKEYIDRTPKQEVTGIARKFPDANGFPCLHHHWLSVNNLLGFDIPMTGQIPSHGKIVKDDNQSCHVHNEIPETDDFLRWANSIFSSEDQEYATQWRADLSNYNFNQIAQIFRENGFNAKTCKSLEDARDIAVAISNTKNTNLFTEHLLRLGVEEVDINNVIKRWHTAGCPAISDFAPYAAHVLMVEIFFYVASAAGLIPSDVNSWLDMCYFHYLPFCMVFVSSDNLHKRCAHLFMRPEQQFIRGIDLKEDLRLLNKHYMTLPEETRKMAMSFIASMPPRDKQNLVAAIWDKHFPAWRNCDKYQTIPKASIEVVERISKFSNSISLSKER